MKIDFFQYLYCIGIGQFTKWSDSANTLPPLSYFGNFWQIIDYNQKKSTTLVTLYMPGKRNTIQFALYFVGWYCAVKLCCRGSDCVTLTWKLKLCLYIKQTNIFQEKHNFTSKTAQYKNCSSADGHCSSCFLSNKVVIGCAEPGRPALQLDQVFLLQALPRQRVPHVLPDYLFHTFLGHLKCNFEQLVVKPKKGRYWKTYHIPSWSQHTCHGTIVQSVSCNCTLESLLPWYETVPDIRIPHKGPFHIN